MGSHSLTLPEEVLLLALDDEKGTAGFGSTHGYALGGAILAELLLRGRVRIDEEGKRKKWVVAVDGVGGTGEPLLDEALARVRSAKRRGSPGTWVQRFSSTRGLQERLARRLCQRGVLRAEEKDVLLFFRRKTWPTMDPAPERALRERVRHAVVSDDELDARTLVLTALAKAGGLLKAAVDAKTIKGRKARLESITDGQAAGAATQEAVQAAQAAAMIATMVATTVATSAATS